ncbi:hypothetical protein LPJ71_004622, partial [Coemansia sp. S17]
MRDTVGFPSAHKLTIFVTGWTITPLCSKDEAIVNVLEFARLIRSVTQGVATAEVIFTGFNKLVGEFDEEASGMFMNLLCANIKSPGLELRDLNIKHTSTVDHIPQLSSLDVRCTTSFDLNTDLVHKSSSSLQILKFGICNARALLYDFHGNSIVYPNMKQLAMFYAPLAYSKERIMAPSTVPFPELESLSINMPYPFADDVLFRGNSTTLKDLDFKIDTDSVHLLYDSGVFANKRRKLRTLTLSKDSRTH